MNFRNQKSSIRLLNTVEESMDDFEEIAADWIARRNGGGLNADEQTRLDVWLKLDPRHRQAFDEMELSWAMLNEPRRFGRADAVWMEVGNCARRRKVYAFATAGLAVAAALMLAFVPLHKPQPAASTGLPSVTVRPDLRMLPDGSTVELNSGAEIAVAYAPDKRGVRLLRGEALFVVAKNAARPFVVTAGTVEVRAVGTAFAVRHEAERINVLVTAGRVAVDRVAETVISGATYQKRAEPVYLDVGRQVAMPTINVDVEPLLQIQTVSADELVAALAWRDRRIEFTDTQLADAVTLFNRQNRVQLWITNDAVARRLITGVFWTDDPEGFVRLLETGFDIKADRSGDAITLRSK